MLNILKKSKLFIFFHLINLLIWLGIALSSAGHISDCYTKLFGKYLNYTLFEWFVLCYMFMGSFLLVILLRVIKSWAYIFFELIMILIIIIYWKVHIC